MKPASARVRWIDRLGRFALILALIWMGWTTVIGVRRLAAPTSAPPSERRLAGERGPLSNLADLAETDLAQGSWTFAGERWTSRLNWVADDDLRVRLDALADFQPSPDDGWTNGVRNPFAAFAKLPVRRTTRGSKTLHDIDANGCRIRLVTTPRLGRDAPIAALLAFRGEPGRWFLVEMWPAGALAEPEATDLEISIPVEAVAVCRWRGVDGRGLRLYRLAPPRGVGALTAGFRARGWTVDSPADGQFQAVVRRGDQSLFAWSPDTETIATLVLQNSPP